MHFPRFSCSRWATLAVVIAATGAFISGGDDAALATTFRPSIGASLSSTALGANANFSVSVSLGTPDANFGGAIVSFSSPELATSSVTIGQTVGYVNRQVTYALLNQGCFTDKIINSRLYAASTDNSPGNSSPPDGPPSNPIANFASDDGDINEDSIVDDASRAANGIPDGAEWYPSFLNIVFNGQTPTHRYFGTQLVSGTPVHEVVQILVFDPGDLLNLPALPSSDLYNANLGTPSVFLVNDPTIPPAQAIEDSCSASTTGVLLCGKTDATPDDALAGGDCDLGSDTVGEPAQGLPGSCLNSLDDDVDGKVNDGCAADGVAESGAECDNALDDDGDDKVNDGCPIVSAPLEVRGTNPSTVGAYGLHILSISLRDLDGDGHENAMDPCPLDADTWDPRATPAQNQAAGADSDADNLPDVCDPSPNTLNHDEDGDGWYNRVDDCPLQVDDSIHLDMDWPPTEGPPLDGGTASDDIGAICDPNPTLPDGHYHFAHLVGRMCLGGTDVDTDGVCNTYQGENDFTPDTDGDGVFDPVDNCIARSNPNLAGLTQMTPDLNGDGQAHIEDVTYVAARFGKHTGEQGYRAAAELASQDGVIHIDDVTSIAAAFGKHC